MRKLKQQESQQELSSRRRTRIGLQLTSSQSSFSQSYRNKLKFSLHLKSDAPSPISSYLQTSHRRNAISQVDDNADLFLRIQKIKEDYIKNFQLGNTEKAIDQLVELLILYAFRDDVIPFLKTYQLIGDTYFKHDCKSYAIQVYSQLSQLCDMFFARKDVCSTLKPQVLMSLAQIAQQYCYYDYAKSFTKKALQYAWYFDNRTLELQCFDRLGKIAYLNANLAKAIYYHNRSQWGRTEPRKSTHIEMAKQNLQWHFNTLPDKTTSIDEILVGKATFLPFYFSVNEPQTEPLPIKPTNKFLLESGVSFIRQPHKFHTLLSPLQEFNELMSSSEFAYEISSPKQHIKKDKDEADINQLNPMETFYHVLKNKADKQEMIYLENLKSKMKKFQGFVPPPKHYSSNRETFHLESKQKKKSLEDIVRERVTNYQNTKSVIKGSKFNNQKIPMKDIIKVGHLSPNRDLDQFGQYAIHSTNPYKLFSNTLEN